MRIDKRQIHIYLAEQKLTVKSLAERIGMKPQNLSNIVTRGSCKPVTAGRIADGLGVTVSDIVKEEN